jgi:hypothetical protein
MGQQHQQQQSRSTMSSHSRKKTPDKLALHSRSQPDLFTSLEEEEVAAVMSATAAEDELRSRGSDRGARYSDRGARGADLGARGADFSDRASSSSSVAENIAANQIKASLLLRVA